MTANHVETDETIAIHCIPEDVTYTVHKSKLAQGSEVFANMFSCCDNAIGNDDDNSQCVDVYESASNIAILIQLLHDPPLPLPLPKPPKKPSHLKHTAPTSSIPYPLLTRILTLADKYALTRKITDPLSTHLATQLSNAPLLVYGLAIQYSLPAIADLASAFLAFTPLEKYSVEEIKVIPTAEAYHKLLLLQTHRNLTIKELLMNEELFPHGYGMCPAHKEYIEAKWDKKRKAIGRDMDSGTDVGDEMAKSLRGKDRRCKVCQKAWVAATDMLAYRCRKVSRRISHLDL